MWQTRQALFTMVKGGVSACVRACYVYVCAHVCVHAGVFPCSVVIFGLGYDSGVSGTMLGNMITHAHRIHGPCSYFQPVI